MSLKPIAPGQASQIQAKFLEGWAHHQQGRLSDAWARYQEVIARDPRHFNALHMAGIIAAQTRNFDVAVDLLARAVEVNPKNPDAHFNRGNALRDLKQSAAAVASFDQAIRLRPDFAEAHNNRGSALKDMRDFVAAIASYDKAIHFKPNFYPAHNNRGNALRDLKEFPSALASFDKALALKPDYADAHFNRGLALQALRQHRQACESFAQAVRFNPHFAEAFHSSGQVLADLKQFPAALAHYDQAINLKPAYAEAHNSRALALQALEQNEAALAAYGKAIEFKADFVEAYTNRAHFLSELKRYPDAIADYDRALAINPDNALLAGARLHAKMNICDWQSFGDDLADLLRMTERDENPAVPFQMLTLIDEPAVHRRSTEAWTVAEHTGNAALGAIAKHPTREKVRIGYFSMDFRNHPVAVLAAGLIDHHDRSRFEVYGFSYGPDTKDHMRTRLENAFDKFLDVRGKTDFEIAALARELDIDIAVDLGGYTNGARTGIFALQAAPIQVNYLGYPGTMGAAYYDYMIADKVVIPAGQRAHYAEPIAYLPHCYQPNDTTRAVSDRVFTRAELGLPEKGFIFCCFNNNFKITPASFDIWMRILTKVEGSVLWLLEDNALAAANLRGEAERRGVDPARLIFAPRMPQGDHLARQRAADLFLDTLPYNAHTSASDALWVGLPLLTCAGRAFAGRVAASILTALDLPELITATSQDYETRAVALANTPGALAEIRRRLEIHRLTAPLFKADLHARAVEQAYCRMVERHHASQPPADIFV